MRLRRPCLLFTWVRAPFDQPMTWYVGDATTIRTYTRREARDIFFRVDVAPERVKERTPGIFSPTKGHAFGGGYQRSRMGQRSAAALPEDYLYGIGVCQHRREEERGRRDTEGRVRWTRSGGGKKKEMGPEKN
jgi:hypothetical protein